MKKISVIILFGSVIAGCSQKVIQTNSGLQYTILKKGNGTTAQQGDHVFIYETTSYRNGTVLYSNYDAANPVKILLGGNQATLAVDEGIRGMQAGEIRQLVAPPYLVKRTGYPANVSPDSTLVIKIRLDRIESN